MNGNTHEPLLILRAKGPATEGGRIQLVDLLRIGRHIQSAVERVARVLVGQADSRRPGRKPQEIVKECTLEVVAFSKGSFEIALDLPRSKFETMHLGVEAVEKLFEGFDKIATDGYELPVGYDTGVLHCLRDMGSILSEGITEIEADTRIQRVSRRFIYNQNTRRQIIEKMHGLVSSLRSIEGRLLMADFRHKNEKCRIHPPVGEPVICIFQEELAETVYEHLRHYVRVTGETTEDPETGRIKSIKLTDIEPVSVEGETFETITGEDFWQEKSLVQLAAEQAVQPLQRIEDILGHGAFLWENDEEFEEFLFAIKSGNNKTD
jgi:hypothetical protein